MGYATTALSPNNSYDTNRSWMQALAPFWPGSRYFLQSWPRSRPSAAENQETARELPSRFSLFLRSPPGTKMPENTIIFVKSKNLTMFRSSEVAKTSSRSRYYFIIGRSSMLELSRKQDRDENGTRLRSRDPVLVPVF